MFLKTLTQLFLICIFALADSIYELLVLGKGDSDTLPFVFRSRSVIQTCVLIAGPFLLNSG